MSDEWVIDEQALRTRLDKVGKLLDDDSIGPFVRAGLVVQEGQLQAAVLALQEGRPVTREILGTALWSTLGRAHDQDRAGDVGDGQAHADVPGEARE